MSIIILRQHLRSNVSFLDNCTVSAHLLTYFTVAFRKDQWQNSLSPIRTLCGRNIRPRQKTHSTAELDAGTLKSMECIRNSLFSPMLLHCQNDLQSSPTLNSV